MKLLLVNQVRNGESLPNIEIDGLELITLDFRHKIMIVEYRDKEFGPGRGEFEFSRWPNDLPDYLFKT